MTLAVGGEPDVLHAGGTWFSIRLETQHYLWWM